METNVWGRARTRVGGGAVAAALGIVGPMLAAGPQAGLAQPAGLAPFASCDTLRQWYVDHTIDQVGAYGWNGPIMFAMREPASAAVPLAGALSVAEDSAVTNSATGTNTQEAGIDEPDVAKTDGRLVVRLQGQDAQEVVVTDVTGSTPRELSTWALPRGAHADGLLLVDGHVLVAGGDARDHVVDSVAGEAADSTDLYDLDLSVPTAPRLVAHTTWSGSNLSLRQYGDTVRLVTSTGLPDLPFVTPGKGLSRSEATARNREVVRSSTIQQWLPHVSLDGAMTYRAVDCSRIYHPEVTGSPRDLATLGVFTLRPGTTTPVSAVAVTGRGSQVYSSSDRLYVWDSSWDDPRVPDARRSPYRPIAKPHTDVHAFALDGVETRYVASGRIDGQARDRWSFDEHDGHLRVALAWPDQLRSTSDNGVVVLDEDGDRLVEVGRLRGLGPDEQIQSVRWFDDLAVVVTFRQTDPLYTVDLSDPEHPRALGELHLPGFSSYLHPIGGDRLLGLGTSGTGTPGGGGKAAVFDIADPTRPRQLGEVGLDDAWLAAAEDPHAFTWAGSSAGAGTAITQVEHPSGGATQVALEVDGDGTVRTRDLPSVGGWEQRALPLPDGRVALVGNSVVVIAAS